LPITWVRVRAVRKPKKLPAECASISYDLEYGQDTLEIHRDAVGNGHRVIIADDCWPLAERRKLFATW